MVPMKSILRVFLRKCRSAAWHARHRYEQLRSARELNRRLQRGNLWLRKITRDPPDVLVGANFAGFGGVHNHIHAIKKYSSLRVEIAPSDGVMQALSAFEFNHYFGKKFNEYPCSNVRAAHTHVFPWFIEWAERARDKCGIRWVHTHHNWYYPEFGVNGIEEWQEEFNIFFLRAARQSDICLCVSKAQQRFLKEQYGIASHFLPNGVDVEACRRGDSAAWGRLTGLKSGFVLFVGRDDPVKDPAFFVELACAMKHRRFVIAGQGISQAVISRDWKLDIPENLSVIGALSHAQVQDAIAASAALVMCSRREGLPTIVLEAMIAGRPVVVPEEDGCLEATDQGRLGFVYRPRDLTSCARAVDSAIEDRRLVAVARDVTERMYDWRRIAKQLDDIYLGVGVPGV